VKKEFELKREQGLLLNPHDSVFNTQTRISEMKQNTDNVTMAQHYYSETKTYYKPTGREVIDEFYDHGENGYTAKTFTYLAYQGFDLVNARTLDNETYMVRFDYHDPLTYDRFTYALYTATVLIVIWFLTNIAVAIYFSHTFLTPLEKMRKSRADLIRNSLVGFDDEGLLLKELFGDLIDDSAMIDASGDEISVMLTLQDRLDAFYTCLIKARSDHLTRVKVNFRQMLNTERIMNYFMRRDDVNAHAILPGLFDCKEIAHRFHRLSLPQNPERGQIIQDYMNAKHSFRSLKSILVNDIATEFFKAFCYQRGRNTINSLFFMMDVGWLHQAESSARSEADDFFSSLLSEPVNPADEPANPQLTHSGSSNSLGSPVERTEAEESVQGPGSPLKESDRPRHSHFAKDVERTNSSKVLSASQTKGIKRKDFPVTPVKIDRTDSFVGTHLASPVILKNAQLISPAQARPSSVRMQFLTKDGDSIAHFIYESYFGRKSLARHDTKRCALLGCSQLRDYVSLRDKEVVLFTPTMYNNLVAAVTKKFTSEVIPEFMESSSFQLMVYCLSMSHFFDEMNSRNKSATSKKPQEEVMDKDVDDPGQISGALVSGMWSACYTPHLQRDDESSATADD